MGRTHAAPLPPQGVAVGPAARSAASEAWGQRSLFWRPVPVASYCQGGICWCRDDLGYAHGAARARLEPCARPGHRGPGARRTQSCQDGGLATAALPVDRSAGRVQHRGHPRLLLRGTQRPTPPTLCEPRQRPWARGGGPPGAPPWGPLGLRAQSSLPSTLCRPRSRCLLKAEQLLKYLHTCWFQKESFHKGCFVRSERVGPGASARPRSGPCPWGVGSNLGGLVLPICLCGAGHPLRPSSGPKAPKSGSRRPPRARGARPREGGTPPCSLPRCASGAGLGRGPLGPRCCPTRPPRGVCACGGRPWLR